MSTFWKPTYQPELYHYGVKGMRWHHHKAEVGAVSSGGGLINPIDAAQEAWWQFRDDVGITDYYKQKYAKDEYEREKGRSWAEKVKRDYEKARKQFYMTPLGKAAKYIDAGKEAVKSFKAYVRDN